MSVPRTSPAAAISAFCLGLSAASLIAAPAVARDDQDEGTVVLPTRGVDLASAAGQAEMMSRINRAARQVCDESDRATFQKRVLFEECRDLAVADASRQVRVLTARAGRSALLVADAAQVPH